MAHTKQTTTDTNSMDDILKSLNDSQKEAVIATAGPVLILAGAGSGKTKTLTHRIAYLHRENKVPLHKILAVTFTNKAAQEMLNRAYSILNISVPKQSFYPFFADNRPVLGTFHSICSKILRQECDKIGYKSSFAIYDADDQLKLVKETLKDLNLDEKRNNPRTILSIISRAKNELKNEEDFEKETDSALKEVASKVYFAYQKSLKKSNAFDFDDLLMKVVEIFRKDLKTLKYYQDMWEYIHVDEYQDTNFAQYVLIQLLSSNNQNICVVGDPDQSIYSFRGADIRNILDFEKDYPNAKIIKLEQNYRSTKNILKASNNVISKNKNRKEKSLFTDNEIGKKILISKFRDEREEADKIIQQVYSLKGEGSLLSEMVILYRINAFSRNLEEACLRYSIPYRIIGGVKFYDRKEIKDILAYLRIILNPNDDLGLQRIINVPPRGIGKTSLDRLHEISLKENMSLFELFKEANFLSSIQNKAKIEIGNFLDLISYFEKERLNLTLSELIEEILDKTGYRTFLESDTTEGESRLENINELLSVTQKYDYLESELALLSFLEEVSLITDADEKLTDGNKLTLMTMHSAKGLEFTHVFIAGAEEGIFPHERSFYSPEELEEERRICYVSMTRAKKELYISCAQRRMFYGTYQENEPSRFLADIPEDTCSNNFVSRPSILKQTTFKEDYVLSTEDSQITNFEEEEPVEIYEKYHFAEGDRVRHKLFAEGTILKITGDIATVQFEKIGQKKLALSIAPLKKL